MKNIPIPTSSDHREPEFRFMMFQVHGSQCLAPCSKINMLSSGMKYAKSKRCLIIAVLLMKGFFLCGIAACFAQPMIADFMSTDAVNMAKRWNQSLVPNQRMARPPFSWTAQNEGYVWDLVKI